ncbi:MAG TPA: hypothetical protein VLE53_09030 [Gemmatimonadaceae bacterium]|nr:hypothetical protein [Gemmatimonadaceae bacterium]
MGLEAACSLRVNGKQTDGRALLESDHLLFRGEGTRLRIPFGEIRALAARDGTLRVTHSAGEASFEIGPAAVKWADRIRNPRTLLDKLGVKPGMRVAVIGVDDASFLEQLAARTSDVTEGRPRAGTDVIVFGAESITALARLARLRAALRPNGAIWVVHRKGRDASLRDVDVFTAARRAGLVDNKVAAFSATHTAERLVIPVAKR